VGAALRAFELLLLREIGLLPALDCVTLTQQPLTDGPAAAEASPSRAGRAAPGAGRYVLRPEVGLTPVAPAAPGSSNSSASSVDPGGTGLAADHWRALQAALDGGDLGALQRACLLAQGELRPMLRQLLHYHLATPELRTRQLMRDLQNLQAGGPGRSR
jgi:DNA repair protein RecO (recombination protein O)